MPFVQTSCSRHRAGATTPSLLTGPADCSSGSGGHIQLFRRFVTPWPCLFWSHATIAIVRVQGCARPSSFLSRAKHSFPRRHASCPFSTRSCCLLAGFLSGAVNAVAGGGTFITFGAMTLVGVPPIVANATSSVDAVSRLRHLDARLLGRHQAFLARRAAALPHLGCRRAGRRADPAGARPTRRSAPWCRGCCSPQPRCSPPDRG